MAKSTQEGKAASSLAGALLEAQASISHVGKDARNSFHKYAYTSAEGMIAATRDALHGAGLAFQRTGWELSQDGQTVVSAFTLHHPASGQSAAYVAPWIVVVEKGKPVDKALAGALTTCMGYFLRDLLLLPREEEGTMDRRKDDPDGPSPKVGFKQERKPDAIAEMNARIGAAPKPKPKPQAQPDPFPRQVEMTVGRVFSRSFNDRVFPMVEASVDGKTETFVCEDAAGKDAQALVGRRAIASVVERGDRTPLIKGIEAVNVPFPQDAEEASGEPDLPF